MAPSPLLSVSLFVIIVSVNCEIYLCVNEDFANGRAKYFNQPCENVESTLTVKKYSDQNKFPPPGNVTNDYYMGTMDELHQCVTHEHNFTLVNPSFEFHQLAHFESNQYACEFQIHGGGTINYSYIKFDQQMVWRDFRIPLMLTGKFKVFMRCFGYDAGPNRSIYALDHIKIYSSVKDGCVEDTHGKNLTITKIDKTITIVETNSTIIVS